MNWNTILVGVLVPISVGISSTAFGIATDLHSRIILLEQHAVVDENGQKNVDEKLEYLITQIDYIKDHLLKMK